MNKTSISSHILNTANGEPAAGIHVELTRMQNDQWLLISQSISNDDGRIAQFASAETLLLGTYRLRFLLSDYFTKDNVEAFFPYADIVFNIQQEQHYHIPLLLSPFGYTTYRGS